VGLLVSPPRLPFRSFDWLPVLVGLLAAAASRKLLELSLVGGPPLRVGPLIVRERD
jgi:hypothetical protein